MASTAPPPPTTATTSTSPLAPDNPRSTSNNASSAPPTTTIAPASPPSRSRSRGTGVFSVNPHHSATRAHRAQLDTYDLGSRERLYTPALIPGLSPYHDGRIRNPVPSKLKGKTDGRQGNFSVMHIDVPKPEMTDRDLAAKRTSEGTAAAARLASTQGYRHPKRPRHNPDLLPAPPRPPAQSRPPSNPPVVLPALPRPILHPPPLAPAPRAASPPFVADAAAEQTRPPPTKTPSVSPKTLGLSPNDTKAEQARLLTLLRSLHPVLVVDQLCKALAYFGGIPGALPPADGVFPQSDSTNGQGSLFVSWVAEIFPHLDRGQQASVQGPSSQTQAPPTIPPVGASGAPSTTDAAPAPFKRSRGRPKGSKSSKVRKDKGIKKKVPPGHGPGAAQTNGATTTQPTSLEQAPTVPRPSTAGDQQLASAVAQAALAAQPTTPQTGKKRGRPKGSKNKHRPQPGSQEGVIDQPTDVTTAQSSNFDVESPLAHKNKTTSDQPDTVATDTTGNTRTGLDGETPSTAHTDPPNSLLTAHEPSMTSEGGNTQGSKVDAQALSRKRTSSQQTHHFDTQATFATSSLQVPSPISPPGGPPQKQTKRRRVSKETSQHPGLSRVESQSTGTESSVSPSMASGGQLSSEANNLGSQTQMNELGGAAKHTSQQLSSHPRQQIQQQHQSLNLHQFNQNQQQQQHQNQHQSPNMNPEQPNQTQQPSTALDRPQGRSPGVLGRIPTQMTPQAYCHQQQQQQQRQQQQRHMASQFGQSAAGSFARTMGSSSPSQFPQQQNATGVNPGFNDRQSLSQQQQQQHQHSQPQSTGSTATPNMAQFQDFSSQNYLDMDYSMNPDPAAAFGNHTQLEAALAEPDMRDRIYHAIGR
ncbi:hypothetical protein FZEAL_8594 [Fusarium zealandicum]|uniref:Uncharacterized protein n=1 Tax=Fusarium zealandicum TaxID=1053134 RepID=A0A8H4UDW7_9HYPO|nr:hypothetical protein FZEAL_8594 [Fusarium zealandicum]